MLAENIIYINAYKYLYFSKPMQFFAYGIISRRPKIPHNRMKTMKSLHFGKNPIELIEKRIG